MQMLDKNYNKLEIGDKVLLFGMIGTVYQDTNALGLFISFWELMNNLTTGEEDVCHIAEKQLPY